jgi:hypothetical protein
VKVHLRFTWLVWSDLIKGTLFYIFVGYGDGAKEWRVE